MENRTESGTENLRDLERLLDSQLEPDSPFPHALQTSCTIREGQLMILIHCPEATQPQSQELFNRIRAIIARDRPSQLEDLQLYLIIHGQRILPEARAASALLRLSTVLNFPASLRGTSPRVALLSIQGWQYRWQQTLLHLRDRPGLLTGLASGSGLLVTLVALYGLTRPCVIGSCGLLSESEERARAAEASLTQATTTSDLQAAQGQLDQAIRTLQGIPPWSRAYAPTRPLLEDYQQTAQQIEPVIASLNLGQQAQTLMQNPALSPQEAQRVQSLWQSALSYLPPVSPQSPLSRLVQAKRRDYQGRLSQVEQDLHQDQMAIATLHRAEETATLAQSRQETARSLQDWQTVTATWATVLKLLRQVPPDSSVSDAARTALSRYLPAWVKASKRQELEQTAQSQYLQATQAAQAAEAAQEQQREADAVGSWQQAIAHLSTIAPQSLPFPAAQNLLPTYRLALEQAEAQRDRKAELQAFRQELDGICLNPEKICDYTLSENAIHLTLTAAYLAQVWNRSLAAQAQANLPTQMAILNHVARLEQNLQWLSQKSGLPIEVYNPQGTLISRYGMR